MKAFLSHSSVNKEFVRQIANKLGRLQCIFDERSFSGGQEFKTSIVEHLDKTSVFVFIATQESLDSFWCDFEIDEAFYGTLKKNIDKAVVYIIEDGVELARIPSWLKKALIKTEHSPNAIARDIQHHLSMVGSDYQKKYFLGRSSSRESLEDLFNPTDGSHPPKIIGINGLPGIGRRSLLKRSVSDLFNLDKVVEISVEPGDSIFDFCIKTADIIEPYSCQEELIKIIADINLLNETDVTNRALKNLKGIIESGELPLLVDHGGLFDDNSYLVEFLNKIFDLIRPEDDIYVALISPRRISKENPFSIPFLPVKQLSSKSTKQLIAKLAEDNQLKLNIEELSELSDFINGYPPSAYFAIQQGVDYGKDLLVSDKASLVNFSTKRFMHHIKKQNLSDDVSGVLSLLAHYSPLPLQTISAVLGKNSHQAHDCIYRLIDYSLIAIDDDNNYKIADPIAESARRLMGPLTKQTLTLLKDALEGHILAVNNGKTLESSRILFRLGCVLGDEVSKGKGISLKSDYIKLLKETYHIRDYQEAVKVGYVAIRECPDNTEARTFLIKALIQTDKWSAANEQILAMGAFAEPRNIFYLKGFLERKRGHIDDAIKAFRDSETHGRKDPGIKRELAHCYLLNDNLPEADRYIKDALKRQSDNHIVIDMATKIKIRLKEENEAKKLLAKLALFDDSEQYHLRLSSFHYEFGRFQDAVNSANQSIKLGGKRFFAGRIQYVKSLIKNKSIVDANKELNKVDVDFNDSKVDIRITLRCTLLILENKHKLAYDLLNKFKEKRSKHYLSVKRKCLEGMCTNVSIPYKEREKYIAELQVLKDFDLDDVLGIIGA